MKIKSLALAIAINIFAVGSVWAQQQPDSNLLAQLEKRLAESNTKAKGLTGGPKSLWLLREAKIEKIIDRLKAGQSVDPKEIDAILTGRVN